MPDTKLNIFVDDDSDFDDLSARGMLPGISNISNQLISVATGTLKDNIARTLNSIVDTLSDVDLEGNAYQVEQVKFTIAFDAKGEVGLMSVVKGGLSGKTGLEIILKRRQE